MLRQPGPNGPAEIRLMLSHSMQGSAGTGFAPVSAFRCFTFEAGTMGLFDVLRRLFGGREPFTGTPWSQRFGIDELAQRLGVGIDELRAARPSYREWFIPKRSGGKRRILAPEEALKQLQRRILRRVLGRLRCHPAVRGFQRGQSIVTNALGHARQAVVLRMDLKNFFESTSAERIGRYFQAVGWDREAAKLLVRLCTYQRGLPQGAPTSPRLSNLVNVRLDARLARLAQKHGAYYTRYADDLTLSFREDHPRAIRAVIRATKRIVADMGYQLHQRTKLHVRRRYECQIVTGLVVNERVDLPRATRRWLRAVQHRLATNRQATLTPDQLAGWKALRAMIAKQAGKQGLPGR
jgi:retron-type reverse transcriptase